MSTLTEFRDLVEKMRHAQKEYFRTTSPAALSQAKSLEKQVDRELAKLAEGQRELFKEETT